MRLIDADKLLAVVAYKGGIDTEFTKTVQDIVDNRPTEDAVFVKHGHWILQTNGHGVCSVCCTSVDLLGGMVWNYCPHCGAKMGVSE